MKGEHIIKNHITFSQSLVSFALSFYEKAQALETIRVIENQGFSKYLNKAYGEEEQKHGLELIRFYSNYVTLLMESDTMIYQRFLTNGAQLIYEVMLAKDFYHNAEKIIDNNGFLFKELREGGIVRTEVFVENIDFEKKLKEKSDTLKEKKSCVVYIENHELQKLKKLEDCLKSSNFSFSTRKEFYVNVLRRVLPNDFKEYKEEEQDTLLNSRLFRRYWDLFSHQEE